ncbi:MAG: hypothetical protein R3C40_08920 [Parvularculaceae bacterium]
MSSLMRGPSFFGGVWAKGLRDIKVSPVAASTRHEKNTGGGKPIR